MACLTSDIPQKGPFFGVERWFSLGCNPVFKRCLWSQWCIAKHQPNQIQLVIEVIDFHNFDHHTVDGCKILHQLVTIGSYETLFFYWDNHGMFTIYQLVIRISQPSAETLLNPSHPYATATFSSRGWALLFSLGPCFSATARSFWFWLRGNTWHPAFHGDGPAISWTSRLEGLPPSMLG